MGKIIFIMVLIFNLLLFGTGNTGEITGVASPEILKNYVYFIQKGGIFRFEEGKSYIEAYLQIGTPESSLIELNDVKTLYSLNYEMSDKMVKRIWITSEYIRTPDGTGIGSPIDKFRKYQSINITGSLESYSPPYSGVVFCSTIDNGLIDLILLCSPQISSSIYNNASSSVSASYIINSNITQVHLTMNEIIENLYYSLGITPCYLNDVILLESKRELGEICSLYGGNNHPVTSFCINEAGGSVIYILKDGLRDSEFKGILAHEYAHIWHYRYKGYQETDPSISEGFAEWVRYHYEGEHFQLCDEKYYTEGLKKFLEIEDKKGSKGVFEYLSEN